MKQPGANHSTSGNTSGSISKAGRRWRLVVISVMWVLFALLTLVEGSVERIGFSGYILVVLIASILLGHQSGIIFALLSIFASAGAYFVVSQGFLVIPAPDLPSSIASAWAIQAILLISILGLVHIVLRGLESALTRAQRNQEHLERRATELQVSADVARDATAIRQVDALLHRAVNLISDRFGFYHAGIFILDQSKKYAVLKAATGTTGERMLAIGHKLRVGDSGIVGHVAASGSPYVVNSVDEDPIHMKNPLLTKTRAEMAMPLIVNAQVIGVLDVQSEAVAAFDAEDTAILQTLADQLAIAYENARLFEARAKQLEELTVLHSVATASTEATNESALIEIATQVIGDTLHPDIYGVFLLNSGTGLLHEHPSYRRQEGKTQVPIPIGAGIVGIVALDGQTRLIGNVAEDPAYIAGDPRICSEICVPLKAGGQILGVINAESTRTNAFTTDDERMLTILAGQLATAMVKIRLFEEKQQQVYELALLLESSGTVSGTLKMDEILAASAEHITNALNVDGCTIYRWHPKTGTLVTLFDLVKHPFGKPEETGTTHHLANFPATLAVLEKQLPLIVQVNEDHKAPDEREWLLSKGLESLLMVPLVARGHVIGSLRLVTTAAERHFSPREINLCQTMANQLAAGLENARLFEAEHRRGEELEALRKASIQLTSSLEWQPTMEAVLDQAIRLINADSAHIYFYDRERLTFGATKVAVASREKPPARGRIFDLTRSVAGSGKLLVVPDMSSHPLLEGQNLQGALISLPLAMGRDVLGVMNVQFNTPHRIDQNELRVLSLLADQTAVAMENIRLFTETKRRTKELSAALTRLKELDRLKSEFIQNVSHELRTPLAIVRGYAELLEQGNMGKVSAQLQKPVSVIVRRVRMLSKLVDDLTAILEVEAENMKQTPIDLAALVRTQMADYQNDLERCGLTSEVKIEPGLPKIMGDPDQFNRVIDNLVGNAIKFTPEGGKISVSLGRKGETLEFEVQDTGVGIQEAHLEHIFERFYQVDGSSKRRYGGTGLGLALVKEITEAHGGTIHVESHPNQGSTFLIRLPLSQDKEISKQVQENPV